MSEGSLGACLGCAGETCCRRRALLAGLGLGALCVGCDDSATNAHTLFGNTVAEQPGETRSQAVDRMTEQYGPATIVRVYSAGMPEPWPDLNRDLGKVPLVVSFKIDPADVLSRFRRRRPARVHT